MISPLQAKLARIALGLSQQEVANHFDKSHSFISQLENGISDPQVSNLRKLQAFYNVHGIEFLDGDGIRRRTSQILRFEGVEGFKAFMDDVYVTARDHGGDICLFNSKPSMWLKWLGEEWYDAHSRRMQELGDRIRVRITVQEGEAHFILGSAEHRWFPRAVWKSKVCYAYGPKLAFLDFSNDDVQILVLDQGEFAESFRILFDIAWEHEAVALSQGA